MVYKYIYHCDMEIETVFQGIHVHFELTNYRYHTIMWWERTQFSNSTFGDWCSFISLKMNSDTLVGEHQSLKCFDEEPTIANNVVMQSETPTKSMVNSYLVVTTTITILICVLWEVGGHPI